MFVQRRLLSRVISWNFKNIRSQNDSLEVVFEEKGKPAKLIMPLVWLRDHCTSKKHYHQPTNQRKSNCTELLNQAKIKGADQISFDEKSIIINWIDGHQSIFDIEDIVGKGRMRRLEQRKLDRGMELWDSEKLKEVPRISNELRLSEV
ncbi:hypothetical protein CAEBREN_14008 [Caenorhabditis brenneri]|uniref:Gamma-butyrobetaine hydroxylase-like N-terminal domain-containing protein n=1 Tax=Caenorhabditis brenneri TaxID=135651 RepID=G0N420_CAEBE|nr:hypothetical protein CAEBREN_14008 [Caenorhabditis brenneri]